MIQLRIYTLATKEAARLYADVYWKRHITSLEKYQIHTLEVYCEKGTKEATRVFAIVFYDGDDMDAQNEKYMAGPEFKEDMRGFDFANILDVQTVNLDRM